MLKNEAQAAKQITLILLHYMGGSKREWCFLTPLLDRSFKILTIDMPGFGTAVENKNFSICQMADYVDNFIIENKLSHVIIIGHSMSGKVSMILANREPNYLIGLVLLCPSPPCAQNMSKENIDVLVNWHQTFSEAASFVDNASVIRLDIFSRHVAITDAETANPEAFANWATQGSQEDWSSRLSKIMLPSMLILGELDKQVPGLEFQKENTANFLLEPDIEIFPKAGHLIPYQYPMQLSKAINKFIIKHFLHSIEG